MWAIILKKRTESIYYFEYLHGDKRAWTLVTYFKGRKDTFAIQTGIGESSDFISIMESIELKINYKIVKKIYSYDSFSCMV